MFTPTTAARPRVRRRRARRRAAAATAPSLLKPMRLRSPRSASRRHRRGRSLPGCAWAVTVPTSTKPKPSIVSPSTARASLSKPAARPKRPGTVRPNTSTRPAAGAEKTFVSTWASPGTRPTEAISPNASSCARSGSSRRRTRSNRTRYTATNLAAPPLGAAGPRAPQQDEPDDGQHERNVAVAGAELRPHRLVGEVLGDCERERPDREHTHELDRDREPRDRAPPARGPGEGDRREDVDQAREQGQRVREGRLGEPRRDLGEGARGRGEREKPVDEDDDAPPAVRGAARLGGRHADHSTRTRYCRNAVVSAAIRSTTELHLVRSRKDTTAAAGRISSIEIA